MIVVDSSVWIDLLKNRDTRQTVRLKTLVAARATILVGDLILVEVLQGTRDADDFTRSLAMLSRFDGFAVSGPEVALVAARHYRALRERGITVRKTIDTLIATRCILDRLPLLYSDRDFDPFVQHLGLRSALDLASGVN